MSKSKRNSTESTTSTDNKYTKLMNIEYTYPSPSDSEFQNKIYTKREFYYHKIPGRDELKD